jgi:carboxylate-amine ligase
MVDELGTRKEVEYAYKILAEGSSADRQLAVYERTGDLNAVVDHLIAESEEGVMDRSAEDGKAATASS